MDLTQQGAFVNSLVLVELVDRSIRGLNLFEDMPEFVLGARYLYSHGIPETTSNHSLRLDFYELWPTEASLT